jgi:hypothetical protein
MRSVTAETADVIADPFNGWALVLQPYILGVAWEGRKNKYAKTVAVIRVKA